jgi:biotin carboxyl carrier protein
VVGLPNNLPFLARVASHPSFVRGGVDTSFLAHHLQECLPVQKPVPPSAVLLAAAAHALRMHGAGAAAAAGAAGPWGASDGGRPGLPAAAAFTLPFHDDAMAVPAAAGAAAAGAAAAGAAPKAGKGGAPKPDLHAHARAVVRPAGTVTVGTSAERLPAFTITVGAAAAGAGQVAAGGDLHAGTYTVAGTLTPTTDAACAATVIPGFPASATSGVAVPGTSAYRLTLHISPSASAAGGSSPSGSSSSTTSTTSSSSTLVRHASVVLSQEKGGLDTYVWPEQQLPHQGGPGGGAGEAPAYKLTLPQPAFGSGSGSSGGAASVVTPMPGKVVKVLVQSGEGVAAGTPLLILEAMKMEHVIRATGDGEVAAVHYKAGEFVEDGKTLVTFAAAAAATAAKGKK